MKKNFKFYAVAWAILLAVYNVVVFAVRPIIPGYVIRYDARFWLAWAFILAAFVGQLVCAYTAFKPESREKLFLNLPLITESYTALIVMTLAGSGLMLIPDCPVWIATVVCVVIFGFSALTLIKAKAAAELTMDVGARVKAQALFIKSLTVDAEGLLARAKSEEVKAELKKVCEAVRYSDPMSKAALADIEAQISIKFDALAKAVETGTAESVKTAAGELLILIGERNKKCRLLK